MIPYGRQCLDDEDKQAVREILDGDWLTQGPSVTAFEKRVAAHCKAQHAIAANSATSALHIACLALGAGEGDLVWTSPNTFVSSANCARMCGADVDFVDIDSRSYNMSVEALKAKLETAERLPKIVIPVHFAGQPCDMQAIHALSQEYGFRIIEDAAHAIGGSYRGEPVGNCRYSDITVFSFHPVKIITTAEGGMALTNENDLAQRMRLLASHQVTRDEALMDREPDGPWYYQQVGLGYNYRMTDVQAALGLSQMKKLEHFVDRRHALAARYDELLADLAVTTPWQHPDGRSALHLYPVRVDATKRRAVFESLREKGIGVNVHYIPVHTQPYYRGLGFCEGDFPQAEGYYAEAISLPMFGCMTDNQQDEVVEALKASL